MKISRSFGFAAALMAVAAVAGAAELKSGLPVGKQVAAFQVVKCAGAVEDGVKAGQELCYRWKYGARPVVMVFARKTDDSLASLVKQLDELIAKNEDKDLVSFVNIIGSSDHEKLEASAKEFGEKNKVKSVALVVPVESENGPADFGINPEAEVTVMVYNGVKVKANHAFAANGLDKKAIAAIVESVKNELK